MEKRTKRAGLAALLLLLLFLSGCAGKSETKKRYQISTTELFDTVSVIVGYAESERTFRDTADRMIAELKEYHQLYDIYHTYEGLTNLKSLNDAAGGEALAVDGRILDLLDLARTLWGKSGGKVDVTLGAVLRLWHEAREAGLAHPESAAPPDPEALEKAARHTGFELLEIDREAGTVRLTDPEASLDVGALAKGFACQRVCSRFEAGYLVNLGGNVYATGPKPEAGGAWGVGIQDPDGSDYLYAVTLEKGAVVTSGDYQRYFEAEGKRLHHLIDPDTLQPAARWRSVTILAEDSGIADGLSTALFLMDREAGEALLGEYGAEAAWISPAGEMLYTEGYRDRIR